MARSLRLACLVVALVSAPCSADPLNPLDYPSLGNLSLGSGSIIINTNTLTMTGSVGFLGISRPQENGDSQIAIFNFDSINLGGGVTVSITGDRPLALLSRGSAVVLPQLLMNATVPFSSETRPGPGGYFGGYANGPSSPNVANGSGPGGGVSYGFLSIGGSFGGMSGTITGFSPNVPGTAPYGDLLSKLEGGSGGGVTNNAGSGASSGGSGGGAIEIGAVGSLTLGFIQSNGSVATSSVSGFSAGGGAGGGILVHADGGVTLTNQLQARGGNAATGFGGNFATGGGGGRIALLGLSTQTLGTTPGPGGIFDLTGGASASGPAGFAGVVTVGAITTVVPNGRSVVLDGDPVISIPGGANQTQPTYEAIIDRDLSINAGGSVTLGKSDPLRSDSDLTVDGTFSTGPYSQTVDRLLGDGTVIIDRDGKLTIGSGSVPSTFTGQTSGAGQLVKIGAGTATIDVITHTGGVDVRAGAVLVTVQTNLSSTATFVKSGVGELESTGSWVHAGKTHITGGRLAFSGGAVNSGDSIVIEGGAELEVTGLNVPRPIDGASASSRITTFGTTTLGVASSFAGFQHEGIFAISGATTVNSRGFASLGAHTELIGGATLNAPNGVALSIGDNLLGTGTVNAKVAAGLGSVIEAVGGNLAVGSAASTTGFTSDGELRTGVNDVTLNDSNEAVLGSLTTLGDGTNEGSLIAGDAMIGDTHVHLLLSEGRNMVGRGNVVGNFKNNGHVEGDGTGAGQRIVFDSPWIVSGIGSFTNTMVNGTFAPGLSPGVVQTSNLELGGLLEIELGGAEPGIGAGHHDQVNDDATLALIGAPTLAIKSYGGFLPTLGQEFDIINAADGVSGGFGAVTIDPWLLAQGIGFELLEDSEGLSLRAVAAAGDFTADGMVDGLDFLAWQRGFGTLGASDLADWKARFGTDSGNGATIPEPASIVLVLAAALAWGRRRTVGNAL